MAASPSLILVLCVPPSASSAARRSALGTDAKGSESQRLGVRLLEHREVLQIVRAGIGIARIVWCDAAPWGQVDAELAVREDRVPKDAVLDRGHSGDEVPDTDADVPVVGDDVPSPGGHSADLVV